MIHSWRAGQRRKAEVLEIWEKQAITFPPIEDANPSKEPLVISARIANHQVGRVYVDSGSAIDIMYEHCFLQFPMEIQRSISEYNSPLVGFSGETNWPIGRVDLEVCLGSYPRHRIATLNFIIVRSPSRHNVILGRTGMQTFGAVISTVHGMMKFPTMEGIATLRRSPQRTICAPVAIAPANEGEPPRMDEEDVILSQAYPQQAVKINCLLPENIKVQLTEILRQNIDVFAFCYADMTGVPRSIAEHRLNINPSLTPVKQKKRGMAPDRSRFLTTEVEGLVKARVMREVINPLYDRLN